MRVRVVVVSWNSGEVLPRCIAHLRATRWNHGDLQVVVVDNGSTDGSTARWEERYPSIELRQTGRNLGFGGAANVGIADLDGLDAVALVNPDAFVEPGWLEPLADALAQDPGLGAASPKIIFDAPGAQGSSVINNVGNVLGPTWEFHDRGYGETDLGQYDEPTEIWGWCGGAVLLRASYLLDVGPFDERLFLYAEDVELSWRGSRKGWRYRYVPAAVVRHMHRASSGGERTPLLDLLNRRNRLVVVSRHGGVRGASVAWSRAIGGIALALLPSSARREAPARRRARAAFDAARILLGGRPRLPGVDDRPGLIAP
ncbi:MAG: glycosyltransferase family 2 protein [Microthrixaceae bacterium]